MYGEATVGLKSLYRLPLGSDRRVLAVGVEVGKAL